MVLGLGAVLGLVVVGGAGWYVFRGAGSAASSAATPPDAGKDNIDALTQTLVANQVQLARKKLEDKSYAAARSQAERALKLDANSAEAKKILQEAQAHLKDLESASAAVRTGLTANDSTQAAEALWSLLTLDPNYEGADDLAQALDKDFKGRADEAHKLMDQSRVAAERSNATSVDAFAEASGQAKTGQTYFANGSFGRAARRFLLARDGFERARGASRR